MNLPHEIIKKKSQVFRTNCIARAKKLNIPVSLVPMPTQFAEWLTSQPITIKRKRLYLTCYLTGALVPLAKIELDHRLPISRGGSFQVYNLGITDGRINGCKGNRSEQEFRQLLDVIAEWDEESRKSLLADLRAGSSRFRKF